MTSIESAAEKAGLKLGLRQHFKEGDCLRCHWVVFGKSPAHEEFIQYLMDEPDIKEFRY